VAAPQSLTLTAASVAETQAIAERLGRLLVAGDVLALIGPLGAGKTTFVQGLARGLDVPGPVTSPTFVLVNRYRGRLPVHHLDAYRTDRLTDLLDLGLDEMMHGDGVTVIEWADKLLPLLPADAVLVTITGLGDEAREILIQTGMQAASSPGS